MSFSSTVFAIKVLESKREMSSRHASTAIGILIMQDITAVVFLAVSTGKVPSLWSMPVVLSLIITRPVLVRLMLQCGHGELLALFGVLMTVAGYNGFEMVGLKGDLGALVFGMLLAAHPKASELSDKLLGFIEPANSRIQLVMFALPDPKNSIFAIRQMKKRGLTPFTACTRKRASDLPSMYATSSVSAASKKAG